MVYPNPEDAQGEIAFKLPQTSTKNLAMLKVLKYEIEISDYFEIEMPNGAQILKAECQHNRPYLWVLADLEYLPVKRTFRFAGTGHPIKHQKNELKFISTFQMDKGNLIFHIFEVVI